MDLILKLLFAAAAVFALTQFAEYWRLRKRSRRYGYDCRSDDAAVMGIAGVYVIVLILGILVFTRG